MMQNPDQRLIWDDPDDPAHVLVLDDDATIREIVQQSLTRAGFSVMTASEGSEGLQVLLDNRFDVVVTDLMMEPMDGITFLHEALKIWPWLGVVIISGFIEENLYQQAKSLGVRAVLHKPLQLDELKRSVIEEARRMRHRVGSGGAGELTLSRVLYQLDMLRENTRTAIESANMRQALLGLCRDLGMVLPSVFTAIMCESDDEKPVYAASLRRSVPPSYLPRIKEMIQERYQRLSGIRFAAEDEVTWALTGLTPEEDAPVPQSDPLYFPIFSGSKVNGILLFMPPDGSTCGESDISFLYHAANHFTTILAAFHRIRELAVRDALTGLYNRHHLQDELPGIWGMASRYGLNPAFLILDVDHFKMINDNYGHTAGDDAMRALASIVKKTCRNSDLIARYGGDEVVAVLPDADPASLGKLAERMQKAIREQEFSPETHAFHFTVSIGAASCRKANGDMIDVEELLIHADEALYTAKRNGRNRSIVWSGGGVDEVILVEKEGEDAESAARKTSGQPSVVIVDDDEAVLKLLKVYLQAETINVKTFNNSLEALESLRASPNQFAVAFVDLNLGDISGLELIQRMQEANPFLVSIVITGDATLENAVSSLRHGAYDFIQKPVQRGQLKMTMDRALEYHRLRLENEEYQHNLEAMVKRKSLELTSALKRTRDSLDFTLRALAAMLDARENSTGAHSQRVRDLTVMIARKYGLAEKEVDGVRQGALLHDIGKIGVPDRILLKEGPLDEQEWKIMRKHVEIGHDLIKSSPDLTVAADMMLCHHEEYDGTGYPRGLQGEEIPLGARIFSVVDAYDAMRSTRPYRVGMSKEDAVAELRDNSGTQFDPDIVQCFLEHLDEIESMGKWDDGPTPQP